MPSDARAWHPGRAGGIQRRELRGAAGGLLVPTSGGMFAALSKHDPLGVAGALPCTCGAMELA